MSTTGGTLLISADQLLRVDSKWDMEGVLQGFSDRTKVSRGLLDNNEIRIPPQSVCLTNLFEVTRAHGKWRCLGPFPFSSYEKQRRKKRTQPPPKEILLENFSGLKEKLSRPVVDTKTLQKPGKPYPPPKSFLCGPHFFYKEKFCTGAGRCMLSFSSYEEAATR